VDAIAPMLLENPNNRAAVIFLGQFDFFDYFDAVGVLPQPHHSTV
jgi:hypothetical protein